MAAKKQKKEDKIEIPEQTKKYPKKIGAPYGNKNAEKWTFKKAIQLFNDAISLSNEEEIFYLKTNEKAVEVFGYKYDFIGEIARKLGTDHQLMIRHLPNRFPSLERLKNQLLNNLESNCYANTKKGVIKEATGLVNLKSNHKWTDRTQNELTGKDGKDLIDLTNATITFK